MLSLVIILLMISSTSSVSGEEFNSSFSLLWVWAGNYNYIGHLFEILIGLS